MIKNILITGGAGYIGSHIVEKFLKKNKKLVIVDNLSTGHRQLLNKKTKFIKININNTKKLNSVIRENKIDSIVHLAASLIIEQGEKNPRFFYKNNVLATKSLVNACNGTNVKNLIFSSTAAVYKEGIKSVNEKSKLQPKSIYGKTKLKAEKLIERYCKKKKINYAILRYFNVVGSSPSGKIGLINKSDHLFKNFSVESLKKTPKFKIYGNDYKTIDGTCIRDFIHVTDIAQIHYKVLDKIDKSNKSKILNCGYGKGISVKQVLRTFKKNVKKDIKIVNLPRRKGDLSEIIASNKNLKKFIKWKPKLSSLNLMVKSSIKWEKKLR